MKAARSDVRPDGDPAIAADAIVCWHLDPGAIGQARLCHAYERILDPRERARHDTISDPTRRGSFLAGRCLARLALAQHTKGDPHPWRFGVRPDGKPVVSTPPGLSLFFNLSHTDDLVVCAVTSAGEIGVDVERLDRPGDILGLAARLLAASEMDDLRACPPRARRHRFLEYWTLKEAYLKARGTGLSLPSSQIAFSLEPWIRLVGAPASGRNAAVWEFLRLRPTERHLVAIAVDRGLPAGEAPPVRVVLRDGAEYLTA